MEELACAGGGGVGAGPLGDGFPNCLDGANGVVCQTAQGLCDEWDELHSSSATVGQVRCQFAPNADLQSMARSSSGTAYGEVLKG